MSICIWPDGDWCYDNDLEESLSYKSDDFFSIALSASLEELYNTLRDHHLLCIFEELQEVFGL